MKKGQKHTAESKLKNRLSHLGKHSSEKTKRKISLSLMGNTHGFQKGHSIGFQKGHTFSKGKNNPFYGKKHTEETKRKLSERVITEETRKKIGLAKKGQITSEKTIQKIKNALSKNPFVIHHINGNHFDDTPGNRIKITRSEHTKIHNIQRDVGWGKYHDNQLLNLTKSNGGKK